MIEEYNANDEVEYKTVMKNTCTSWNLEYTITMSAHDWDNVQYMYTTFDDAGNTVRDSVIKQCVEDTDNAANRKCTFTLGKIAAAQCAELGLSDCQQPMAGWLNGAGDYGQVSSRG